jgi:hypothetical protein
MKTETPKNKRAFQKFFDDKAKLEAARRQKYHGGKKVSRQPNSDASKTELHWKGFF